MSRYQVARVGWANENKIPIVLLDKRERNALGVVPEGIVNVKHGSNKAQAIVHVQFIDLIRSGKATVSTRLSTQIDCIEGDEIEITNDATEVEQQSLKQLIHERIIRINNQTNPTNQIPPSQRGGLIQPSRRANMPSCFFIIRGQRG